MNVMCKNPQTVHHKWTAETKNGMKDEAGLSAASVGHVGDVETQPRGLAFTQHLVSITM